MKRYIYTFLAMLCFVNAMAQTRPITGVIKDANGSLPGVTVIEKQNPSNGTQTDAEGKFKLNVKSNTLVVRFIGYATQEVSVQRLNSINITLKEVQKDLNEVVVVGYGQQRKVSLTGAVSALSGADIRQSPSPSLQNALAGRITGFSSEQRGGQPGKDGASFNIRGVSSYTGNNNPLILVDDIEFTYDQFSQLNANEIASISILKDASTTAIYGIKGANGVVLVTTVRGKVGKPQITFLSEYGLNQPTRRPKYLDSYGAATVIRTAQINSNAINPNPSFVPTFSEADLQAFKDGTDPYGHPNNNWTDLLLKEFAPQWRANFDVTGGTEKAKYFVSLGYLDQGGQFKDYSADLDSRTYYKRYNYRSNVDLSINKNLDVRFDLFGAIDETALNNASVDGNLFSDLSRFNETAPYNYPVYNPDGSLGYSVWQRSGTDRSNNNIIGRLMYDGSGHNYSNNINLASSIIQKLGFITKGLSVKGTLAYRNLYSYYRGITRPTAGTGFLSYIYDPKTNTYSFGARDNFYRMSVPTLTYTPGSTNSALTMQAILNYDRSFGKHHVTGLFLYNQNSKTAANTTNTDYNFIPENFKGYTTRLSYNYNNKYLLEVSGAYNGTDRFAAGRRFGLFPAVSAGWNIGEEELFKKHVKFVDLLKLRGSYGLVGVDNTGGVYSYLQSYTTATGTGLFGTATNLGYTTVTEGTLPNNEVTWEKERKLDLGLDFGIINGKLTGALDYFNNNRYDILTTRGTVSAVFGQSLPSVNLGKTNNKGFEAELNFNNKINNNWSYQIRGTYSLAKNKIIFKDEPVPLYPYQAQTGQPIGSALKYTWTGEFYTAADIADPSVPKPTVTGRPGDPKYKDLNGDGVIDASDMSYFGNTNIPTTTYGITLGASYKGVSFTVLFQGVTGVVASAQGAVTSNAASNAQPIYLDHWTPELGNSAKYPQLYTSALSQSPRDYYSSFWAISAAYIRLKTAEIAYTFGPKALQALHVKGLRVYTNGYNLLTWTNLDKLYNLDPEVLESTGTQPYPPTRIINFGFNVTF
ncbi:TonB-linked SusC/RagA family outer membrane protein [Mucilaginibacter yixingensis]|uniref:TonB-linked SusC/RagA family outer membrane protein n=1 Tax=Mucilaginibacter yixingensis TaxID=1295612 RepID=A0A2T5JAK1_9SPHI|nr:TonB-dependent receptor [Mucilaginibacter yixingensis]PTQ97885.1 TonB-linked SusC/RagA family outer membrane protein [Mucilaginibacter yixingensis]